METTRINFEKLNASATKELKKLLGKIPNIRFNEEDPTGFHFETKNGTFWFQCETDTIKGGN